MSVSLTITDNLDGTGGVARIAGSDPASLNTVYSAPSNGQTGPQAWALQGSRTGDGTLNVADIALPIYRGYYNWLVTSFLSPTTTFAGVYQNLSNASVNKPPKRIYDAVQVRIVALNLAGMPAVNILEKWVPRSIDDVDPYPRIVICPWDRETFPVVLSNKDDIGEPFLVAIVDKQNQDNAANLTRNTNWRWQILSALRFQPLAGVPEVNIVFPESSEKLDKEQWDGNLFVSPLLFRAITRTTRG